MITFNSGEHPIGRAFGNKDTWNITLSQLQAQEIFTFIYRFH